MNEYTPLLRLLVRVPTVVLRAQTQGGDMCLDTTNFGDRHAQVKTTMRELAGLSVPVGKD